MNCIIALCASAFVLAGMSGAQAAVVARKPLISAPAHPRLIPAKPVCTGDQGTPLSAGDTSWTSRTSDGVLHDCTPYGCNMDTGLCRTSAANTNQCRPGYTWLTPSSCRLCANGAYWDTTQNKCVSETHPGG